MFNPDESEYVGYDWITELLTVLRFGMGFIGAVVSLGASLVLDRQMTMFSLLVFIGCASVAWLEIRNAPFRA